MTMLSITDAANEAVLFSKLMLWLALATAPVAVAAIEYEAVATQNIRVLYPAPRGTSLAESISVSVKLANP